MLAAGDLRAWRDAAPGLGRGFDADARATTGFLARGERLVAALPVRPRRDAREEAAAEAVLAALHDARARFLRLHAEQLYAVLTDDLRSAVRVEELLDRAAEDFPGLVPTPGAVAAEREHLQGDKDGAEIAQGQLLAHVLSSPRAGSHLVWAMLRPTGEALERLDDFRSTGERTSAGSTCGARAARACSSCATRAT